MSSPLRKRPTKAQNDTNAFVIVGGGIAGVSCAQELAQLCPSAQVTIISESNTVVEAASIFRVTDHLEELAVYERSTDNFKLDNPRISIIKGSVLGVDYDRHRVFYTAGTGNIKASVIYDKLCLCNGVCPKVIVQNANVIGLRDNNSVEDLVCRLKKARKVVVVGNGGIALELIHELTFCDVDWVIKNDYIGSAFFDASASAFIMPSLLLRANTSDIGSGDADSTLSGREQSSPTRVADVGNKGNRIGGDLHVQHLHQQQRNAIEESLHIDIARKEMHKSVVAGYGMGPEWIAKSCMQSFLKQQQDHKKRNDITGKLEIHYKQEVGSISTDGGATWISTLDTVNPSAPNEMLLDPFGPQFPLYVRTTSGQVIECDFVISATGVVPNNSIFTNTYSPAPAPASVSDDNLHSLPPRSSTCGAQQLLQCDPEGYILVDACLRTNLPHVFAAGDCCCFPDSLPMSTFASSSSPSAGPPLPYANHFFQMRLWTQARWMGMYAAQEMCGRAEDFGIEMKFELFSHMTRFFGYKVVMLGRYNGQGLGSSIEALTKQMVVTQDGVQRLDTVSSSQWSPLASVSSSSSSAGAPDLGAAGAAAGAAAVRPNTEVWVRVTAQVEYVKVVVHRGKVVGALLIGDTDLEEVFENLILNALDVSGIGIELLNPDIDIADYFD